MKKLILLLLFIPAVSFTQNMTELTEQNLLRGGNIFILDKLKKYDNSEIKGIPYLNKDFQNGKINFQNGKSYDVQLRLDLVSQNFEIKAKDGKITTITINETVNINLDNEVYRLHNFKSNEFGDIGILRECVVLENISLYYFPRKSLEKPLESSIKAPSSGFKKETLAEWKDSGFYLFYINNEYVKVPSKHKKVLELNIFDNNEYKSYRKKYKLDLKNEQKLIEMVTHFNKI